MNKSLKPVPEHLNDFLDWLDIEKGLSIRSQENYGRFLKTFLVWLEKNNLQKTKPHELTSDHIWQYRIYLSRKHRPPLQKATQNYYLIALRSLLNFFAQRDIVSLPAEKVVLAKNPKENKVRFLDLKQLEKLFEAPDLKTKTGLRDRCILELFFSTGMRISELVSLEKDQIKKDLQEMELQIIGKGSRARTVYISSRAMNWLRKYLNRRNDDEKALFINYRGPEKASRRLTPRAIEKQMKKYVIQAGLPLNSTPHVLRHAFASHLLSQGVDLRSLQEFLGHKNIAATQIYTHVTNKRLRDIHRQHHGELIRQLEHKGLPLEGSRDIPESETKQSNQNNT
jgi:site-specific recombinase XerD